MRLAHEQYILHSWLIGFIVGALDRGTAAVKADGLRMMGSSSVHTSSRWPPCVFTYNGKQVVL